MSREILFRAKRLDSGKWIEGSLLQTNDNVESYKNIIIPKLKNGMVIYANYSDIINKELKIRYWHRVFGHTICQYTGCKDINDKEIFENDIVQDSLHEEYIGVVKFGGYTKCGHEENMTHIGFYIDWNWNSDILRRDLGFWKDKIKVIGNVFDNKELLEVEDE